MAPLSPTAHTSTPSGENTAWKPCAEAAGTPISASSSSDTKGVRPIIWLRATAMAAAVDSTESALGQPRDGRDLRDAHALPAQNSSSETDRSQLDGVHADAPAGQFRSLG